MLCQYNSIARMLFQIQHYCTDPRIYSPSQNTQSQAQRKHVVARCFEQRLHESADTAVGVVDPTDRPPGVPGAIPVSLRTMADVLEDIIPRIIMQRSDP